MQELTVAEQITLLREHLANPDVYDPGKYDQRFTQMMKQYLWMLER